MKYSVALLLAGLISTFPAIAGTVSGQALDENGAPWEGVNVEVVYQTYRADQLMTYGASVKASATTDGEGRYSIDISSMPPGEYAAHAYVIVINGDRPTNVDLVPDDPASFAGADQTVRNFSGGYFEFTDDDPYGNGGVFVLANEIGDYTDLTGAEVTLENLRSGTKIVKVVRPTGEGLIVSGVPFDTYRASATLGGRPLRIALWGAEGEDPFTDSVVHDFTMGWAGNQFRVQVKQ